MFGNIYLFQSTFSIPLGKNTSSLPTDLFLYNYEAKCMQNLVKSGENNFAKFFNFTNKYIDFGDYLKIIYPAFNKRYSFLTSYLEFIMTPINGKIGSYMTNVMTLIFYCQLTFSMKKYTCFTCLRCIYFTINTLWWKLFLTMGFLYNRASCLQVKYWLNDIAIRGLSLPSKIKATIKILLIKQFIWYIFIEEFAVLGSMVLDKQKVLTLPELLVLIFSLAEINMSSYLQVFSSFTLHFELDLCFIFGD